MNAVLYWSSTTFDASAAEATIAINACSRLPARYTCRQKDKKQLLMTINSW